MELAGLSSQFIAKIHPELHFDIAVLLLFLAFLLAFYFVYYEVSMLKRPHERQLLPQLCVSLLASLLFGFGSAFLFVWAGVYV